MSMIINPYAFGGSGGGGGSFDPLSIGWHTAFWAEGPNFAAQSYSNDDPVGTWPDETANGRDATQATGSKQPLYKASVSALNNQPGVKGDSVDDRLRTAAFASSVTGPYTLVIVGHVAATSEALMDGLVFDGRALIDKVLANEWRFYRGKAIQGTPADHDPHLFIAVGDTTDTLEVDGTQIASGDAHTHALTGINLFSNYAATASSFCGGHIAFLALLDGTLTAQEKSDLLSWSQSHYGTPS